MCTECSFLFFKTPRPSLGPTQPHIQWEPGVIHGPVAERPGRESDHSLPSSSEFKSKWSFNSLPPTRLYDVPGDDFTHAFHTALSPVCTRRTSISISTTQHFSAHFTELTDCTRTNRLTTQLAPLSATNNAGIPYVTSKQPHQQLTCRQGCSLLPCLRT